MKMLNKLKNLLIICLFIIINSKSLESFENKILFKVNNEIITTIDIYEEIKFLKIFNPEINNLNEKDLLEISKNTIIREKIKKIEIMNYVEEVKIEDKFLLKFIKDKYSKLGINSLDSFNEFLKSNNLDVKNAKEKIAIELIWNDIIFQKFNSKVIINKDQIRKEILKNSEKKLQRELSLSEIVFDINKKSEFNTKYEKIILDIEQTGFKNAALINSISDTASVGGFIGWVKVDNLNNVIKNEINKLEIGQYSKPIRTSAGFLIIKVEDIKEYEIEFDLDKKIQEAIMFKTNEQLNQLSNNYFNKIKKDLIFDDL
ncbi:peptidylprolyl isomerase [Candidatus Pelagibacter sp. HIMB1483]|uniref:peptidylprolyl isomerase n=1 Tax=Candidatus Pelagibacter sp. HIMB1483 TaxID=3415414 RepID=UPI003F85EA97